MRQRKHSELQVFFDADEDSNVHNKSTFKSEALKVSITSQFSFNIATPLNFFSRMTRKASTTVQFAFTA